MGLLFAPVNALWLVVGVVVLAVKVFALADAAIRPARLWPAAGIPWSKNIWLLVLALAVLFSGLGILGLVALVASIVYLVDVRPKLREVGGGRGNQRQVGPYGPW